MNAPYRHGTTPIEPDTPDGQAALARLHAAGERIACGCATPAPQLYLARIAGQMVPKRMPGTGGTHAPGCPHYEPPPELSGLGPLLGSAIVEGGPGQPTLLRLAFPLSRAASKAAPAAETSSSAASAKTDGTRLSLRGLLHHLWHEAGLARHDPRAPRRNWGTVRERLLAAAAESSARGAPLASRLYIPEPFSQDHKAAIDGRRAALLAPLAQRAAGGPRPLMLLIAEVKEIHPARSGHRLALAHLGPAFPLHLPEDLHRRLQRRFVAELDLWASDEHTRLLLVGTFGLSPAGTPSLEEAALAITTADYAPFESAAERDLLLALHRERRPHLQGLRYNLPSAAPLATAVLTDTRPRPAALYVLPAVVSPEHHASLAELVRRAETAPWFWRTGAEALPPLPPRDRPFDGMPLPEARPEPTDARLAASGKPAPPHHAGNP
jgi:hypothetical protein